MRNFLATFVLIFLVFGTAVLAQGELVFSDEFNAKAKTAPDPSKWTHEIGGKGWGNREHQYYTNSTDNAYHDGNGNLVIEARKIPGDRFSCWYGPCKYTSARLITKGKFEKMYGRFEARIKVPRGQGIWPAFWLLGRNIDFVGWPRCGEIDIMEYIGKEPRKVYGTVHGPGYSGEKGIGSSTKLKNKGEFADDFHIYSIEWTKNKIVWRMDGKKYHSVSRIRLPKDAPWAFDQPFFILCTGYFSCSSCPS